MLRLTGNMLELALRRTGLLFTREALPDEMKRALEETAHILTIQLTELPPEIEDDEAVLRWIENASRLSKLRMFYFLFEEGIRVTGIEEEMQKEQRKLLGRGGF